MEFIVLSQELEEKFNRISRRIHHLQSGGTIESIQTLGVDTRGQIGASFVSLKTLAATFEPDDQLAMLLWKQQKREEQIVACFLFSPNLNKEKIAQLTHSCFSFEIAEYLGSILLSRHPDLKAIAEYGINSPEPFLQVSTLTAIARHLIINKKNPLLTTDFFQQMIKNVFYNGYVEMVAERYRFKF